MARRKDSRGADQAWVPPDGPPAPENGRALRTLALVAVVIGLVALTAAACVLTYTSVHDFALQAGILPSFAKIYPGISDAMLVIAGCSVLALRGAGLISKMYAWLCFIVLLGALAAASVAHEAGLNMPKRAAEITAAVFPWALVLVAFGLLLALLRHARRRRQTRRTNGTANGTLASSRAALEPPALEAAALESAAQDSAALETDGYEEHGYRAGYEAAGGVDGYDAGEYESDPEYGNDGDYGSAGQYESAEEYESGEVYEDPVAYEYGTIKATSQYPAVTTEPAEPTVPTGPIEPIEPPESAGSSDHGDALDHDDAGVDSPLAGSPTVPLPRPGGHPEAGRQDCGPQSQAETAVPPADFPKAAASAAQPPRAVVRPTEMQLRARSRRQPQPATPQPTEPLAATPPTTQPLATAQQQSSVQGPTTQPHTTRSPSGGLPAGKASPDEVPADLVLPGEAPAGEVPTGEVPTSGVPTSEASGGGYTGDTIPRGELNPAPTVDQPADSATPAQADPANAVDGVDESDGAHGTRGSDGADRADRADRADEGQRRATGARTGPPPELDRPRSSPTPPS